MYKIKNKSKFKMDQGPYCKTWIFGSDRGRKQRWKFKGSPAIMFIHTFQELGLQVCTTHPQDIGNYLLNKTSITQEKNPKN